MEINQIQTIDYAEDTKVLTELDVLLKSLDIQYIFSYDDDWNNEKSKKEATENREKMLKLNYREFSRKFVIKILEREETFLLNEDISLVDEIINSDKKEISRLKEMFLKALDKERENNPLIMLKTVLDNIESSKQILIKTFANKFDIGDVEEINGRILFLLDMNMGESTEENDVVIKTILDINKSRPNNHDIAVVYSHEKLEMYKKHDAKVHYVEAYLEKNKPHIDLDNETFKHLLPFQLWAISKGEVGGKLLEILTFTLEKAAFGYSLHDYLERKHKITQRATLDLIKLPEETYEVLYKDSFIEGEVFLDILERTHQSVMCKVDYETIKEDPRIIENLLLVSKTKNERISKEIKGQGIKNYRLENARKKTDPEIYKGVSEFGLLNYSVNSTYSDIMTGDVFVFDTFNPEEKKYGILVTTDCDLPLRPKGNEIKECGRNAKIVTLLLCEGIEFSTTDVQSKKKIEDGEGLWPVLHDGQYCLLIPDTKNELLTIDSRILDLCSLHNDGWANLTPNIELVKNYKTYYFNDYYKNNLSKWISEIDKISTYVPKEIQLPEVATADSGEKLDSYSVQLVTAMAGLKHSIKLNLQDKRFELKRIGRLETRRTLQLIQTKVNHMSRIGLTSVPGA